MNRPPPRVRPWSAIWTSDANRKALRDAIPSVRAHLEYARLALAEGDKDQARGHVIEARRLVDEAGCGRRRPEVEALEAQVR
jgi:hypothetical protein